MYKGIAMEQKYNAKTISFLLLLLVTAQSAWAKHSSSHTYKQPDYLPLLCQNRFAFLAEDKVLPIVLVHGLTQNGASMADTKALLQKLAPGTEIYTPDLPGNAFDNCPYQIQFLADYVNKIPALKDGFNFVAHSMGGVIARGVVESGLLTSRAYGLITLASPHQGVCGIPYALDEIERLNALSEIERLSHKKLSLENPLYEMMYTEYMQHHSSIANIWNEPSQQEFYKKYNLYLPFYNNEIPHSDSVKYKQNLATLLAFTALAAGKDTVLKPLESARWDYYDRTSTKIVPLEESPVYCNLGLNTLAAKNTLKRYTVAGVDHSTIRTDENTLRTYVIPSLIHASQTESSERNL
jgi:palmitoyl-protein thioesterase